MVPDEGSPVERLGFPREHKRQSGAKTKIKSASRTEKLTGWSLEGPVKEDCKTVCRDWLKQTVTSLLAFSYACGFE